MTIREFAALCGVSPATASRFFSGQGRVSEEKQLIMKRMAKISGYEPPASYRSRRQLRIAIFAILPDFRHTFNNNMVEILRVQSAEYGRQLMAVQSDGAANETLLALIIAALPLGVILLGDHQNDRIPVELVHRSIPAIHCGGLSLTRGVSAVHIDNMLAAYDGMRHLIRLNHKCIGLLSDDTRAISTDFQRISGCRRAMDEAGLALPDSRIAYGETTFDGGYRAMSMLLRQAPEVTAVFAFSDDMAAGAAARLWEEGKRIPDDISLLGFDDNECARQLRPALTTIRQPHEQIAHLSITYLLEHTRFQEETSLTLPHELIQRQSCRAL